MKTIKIIKTDLNKCLPGNRGKMLAVSFHLHSENDRHPSQRAIPTTDEWSYEKDLKTAGRRYEHR